MSARARLFLAVLAGIVLVLGTTAAFAAVAVFSTGAFAHQPAATPVPA